MPDRKQLYQKIQNAKNRDARWDRPYVEKPVVIEAPPAKIKPKVVSEYVLLTDAAAFLNLSYPRTLRLAQRGVLPGLVAKFDPNSPQLVHLPTLKAWLEMNTVSAEEKAEFVPPRTPPPTIHKVKAKQAAIALNPIEGMSLADQVQERLRRLRRLRQEIKEQRYRDRMKPYLGPNNW
jgi:hypothetical protein